MIIKKIPEMTATPNAIMRIADNLDLPSWSSNESIVYLLIDFKMPPNIEITGSNKPIRVWFESDGLLGYMAFYLLNCFFVSKLLAYLLLKNEREDSATFFF